jgi:hypothetical protein
MPVLGSVFLGDAHHHRVFSTTPPTSPPPPPSAEPSFTFRAQPARADSAAAMDMDQPKLEVETPKPSEISPGVSLELRLRWLEALLLGVRRDAAREARKLGAEGKAIKEDAKKGEPLFRRAEEVQRGLDAIVASNDGLKRFMEHCPSTHRTNV